MTEQEFKDKVDQAYNKAHDLYYGNGNFDIRRGMGHSMSGHVEDLFAVYMAEKFNNPELKFWVDKVTSIRFSKNGKATSFKPDLMVLKGNGLTHYYDLKTNLGWNRNLEKYLLDKNKFIERIKGRKSWCRIDNEDLHLEISAKLKYQIVLVFGSNINKDLLKGHVEFVKTLDNIDMYILIVKTEDIHVINVEDFKRLHDDSVFQLSA
jgi:hypothetical protein